jgi:hypothetical protein
MTAKEKILNNVELSEYEARELVGYSNFGHNGGFPADHFDGIEFSDAFPGENGRWSVPVLSIFEVDGRYFGLMSSEGLTEYQENEAYSQVAKEYDKVTKTITKTSYELKKKQ